MVNTETVPLRNEKLHIFSKFYQKNHFLVSFKRASAAFGGTINVLGIRAGSELLPATLLSTLDPLDHDSNKSRSKNVKKMPFFKELRKITRHVFQILRVYFWGTILTNPWISGPHFGPSVAIFKGLSISSIFMILEARLYPSQKRLETAILSDFEKL